MGTKRMVILMATVAFLALLWVVSGVGAYPPADEPTGEEGVAIGSMMSLMMKYQGQLLDPATGDPKPDGTYTMSFSIYDVSTGGTALWTETKYVEVEGGLFNTILGDVTSLPQGIFTGQDLWLGIKVEADAETSPRQQLLPMPYAIYAKSADTVDGMEGVNLEESAEIDADISAHAAIADAHHVRYTDAEAWTAVLANDGAGSGLDADLFDGLDSSAFGDITTVAAGTGLSGGGTSGAVMLSADTTYLQRRVIGTCASGNAIRVINTDGTVTCEADDDTTYTAGAGLSLADTAFSVNFAGSGADTTAARSDHGHGAADITSGTLSTARFSAHDDLVAEGKIGSGSDQVSAGDHGHDSRYVNVTGDTMTGDLTVGGDVEADRVVYSSPRTHYFVVGSEGFVPGSNVDYVNTYGNGGAYISVSGFHALVAPVHLPQGAVVTEFKVFFYDDSSGDMTVYLAQQYMTGGGYAWMAQVSSSGISGYDSRIETSISYATIDNTTQSYHVYAYSAAWDSALRIKGALVTYTISEAP